MPEMDAVEIAYRHRRPLREVQRQGKVERFGGAGDDHVYFADGAA